jgi:hypothetical protein
VDGREQSPGGVIAQAGPDLGPLVRTRWGDGVEIFENSKIGAGGMSLLMGLGAGTASLVLDVTAHLWGPWKSVMFGIVLGLMTLPFHTRGWRLRRRFIGAPLLQTLRGTAAGSLIRVAGTVEAEGQVFTAAGAERPVVYARVQFWEAGLHDRPSGAAREDVRGVPFRLRLADGGFLRLQPGAVQLLDTPRPVPQLSRSARKAAGAALRGAVFEREPRFLQATLAPGDRIEAVGYLNTEVSTEGEAAPVRGSPLVHTLQPPENGAVWVRRQPS